MRLSGFFGYRGWKARQKDKKAMAQGTSGKPQMSVKPPNGRSSLFNT
jgi:hypothetical protein